MHFEAKKNITKELLYQLKNGQKMYGWNDRDNLPYV